MNAPTATRIASSLAWTLGAAAATVLLLLTGRLVPTQPLLALAIGLAVLAVGISFAQPAALPLLAVPAVLIVARVDLGGVDLSVSDFALFVALWPAIFMTRRPYSAPMRHLLWLAAIYQASTLFTVIANPYMANTVDWFHTGLLVAGALVVGWAVGFHGYAKPGFTLLLLAAGTLAASTVVQGLTQYAYGNLDPVYTEWPFPMHKNFVGTVLGAVAVIAYTRPVWMGWTKKWALGLFWLCTSAVLLTQSRQALVALALTLLLVVLRTDPDRRRSRIIMLAVAPATAVVASTVRTQVQSGNAFNSTLQRVTWFRDSYDVWVQNPLFGAGLRWWYTDRFPVRFQPPNAEAEVLTTAGVVGLAGFLVLMFGALRVVRRIDPRHGTLALAVLVNRLIQGQLDLFWASVGASLPFLVIGMCLGAYAQSLAVDDPASHGAGRHVNSGA